MRIQKPYAPPVTYIQYDMAIHYLYRALVNVSIGLSRDLMMYNLIYNIRVSMTKIDIQQLQMKFTTQ